MYIDLRSDFLFLCGSSITAYADRHSSFTASPSRCRAILSSVFLHSSCHANSLTNFASNNGQLTGLLYKPGNSSFRRQCGRFGEALQQLESIFYSLLAARIQSRLVGLLYERAQPHFTHPSRPRSSGTRTALPDSTSNNAAIQQKFFEALILIAQNTSHHIRLCQNLAHGQRRAGRSQRSPRRAMANKLGRLHQCHGIESAERMIIRYVV